MNFQTTAVFDFLMATKKSYFHSLAKNCLFYSYWMTCNAMGGRVLCHLTEILSQHVLKRLDRLSNFLTEHVETEIPDKKRSAK